MEHLSDWHDFNPANRSTYPKVDAPVQVRNGDGIVTEGKTFKSLLPRSVSDGSLITNWRYVKDKAID
jgi:hypothetical protein